MTYRIAHSAPRIGEEEIEAVARVMRSGRIAQGPEVEAFENECAAFVGRKYGIAVSSGTAALHIALQTLSPDGRVALPSYGCASLLTAVKLANATPALCDIGADFNLDARTVPNDCNAVIVPHLFGARATLPTHKTIIEDIAQSIGGPTGRTGIVAIASFYATKLMTTGEGGMILSDDEALVDALRDLRDYDNRDDFRVRYNYKMTEIQAAIGRVQLKRLPQFIVRRAEIAKCYTEVFRDLPLALPAGLEHVYFRYVVRIKQRDELESRLRASGIEVKPPVYKPAHHFGGVPCPESERAHLEALSLPIHPGMADSDVAYVADCVDRFFGR